MDYTDHNTIAKTAEFVRAKFQGEASGHDWWHIYRVWQLAKQIAQREKATNMLIVELGALLHDIADWKFHGGDTAVGPKLAREWLSSLEVEVSAIAAVVEIVEHVSYRGGTNSYVMRTLAGKIVQDADRLDALGAIGIARTFAFGGASGKEFYSTYAKPTPDLK